MATYSILQFYMSGDIFSDPNYPLEEYANYLQSFYHLPFTFNGTIKSLSFLLAPNSASRVCNCFVYDQTYDQIVSTSHGRFPRPIAFLTLTLWRNGNPEIVVG